MIGACAWGCDLINTPAEDMGPSELEAEVRALAEQTKGRFRSIVGEELLQEGFPAIHAVGRASDDLHRLLDLTWGEEHPPTITLVGTGV